VTWTKIGNIKGATGAASTVPGPPGTNGVGVPAGGTANQVLAKLDATDYNTLWVNQSGGGLSLPLTQTLTFNPDSTYDIGLAAANRPRDLFLGRNEVVAGTLNVGGTSLLTGAVTAQNGLAVTGGAITGNGSLPTGGSTNQVLAKSSTSDYAVAWVNQTGGSGTTAVTVFEQQAVSGTTVTLPQAPMTNGVIEVAVNGQALIQTRDWTISGAVITFTTALASDDIHVEYQFAPFNPGQYASHYETTLTTGQSSITLPQTPSGIPLLSRSGVVQYQSAGHYSLSGAVITLAVPIGASEDGRISIDYMAGGGTDAATVGGLTPSQLMGKANLLTNGGMEVWQRGNGPFTAGAGTYGADRWAMNLNGTDAVSISKNTANVDVGSQACAAVTFTLGSGGGFSKLGQILRTSDNCQLNGRPITASVRVNTSTANAVRLGIDTDGTGGTRTYSSYHPGSGGYQTLTVTITVPTDATYVWLQIFFTASCTAYLDNAMLVVGSTPADYVPMHPADELARCLRYYEGYSRTNGGNFFVGYAFNSTSMVGSYFWKAVKAVTPTLTLSPAANWRVEGSSVQTCSTVGLSVVATDGASITAQSGTAFGAIGQATMLDANTGQTAVITVEANP